jgi:ABC-type sugar transport system substrate-binding protein
MHFAIQRLSVVLVGCLMATLLVASGSPASAAQKGSSASNTSNTSKVSNVSKSPPKKTIGYVDIEASGGMQKRWYNFFTAATKELGWTVRLTDANGVSSVGLSGIQQYVNDRVNAIVVTCLDTAPLLPGLQAARAAKIPVIEIGCQEPAPLSAWNAVYAEPERQMANYFSSYLVKALSARKCDQVSVLQDDTILIARLRSTMIITALRKAGVNVVSTPVIPETSIVPSTQAAVSGTLTAHPGTCAFIPIFDFSSGPAASELETLNNTTAKVYTYYADDVNDPLLLNPASPLVAVVDGPVEQVSLVAVDQLLNHFMTGAPINEKAANGLKVPFTIFTKSNAPKNYSGYITPWSVNKYLTPFVKKWNAKYGFKLRAPHAS